MANLKLGPVTAAFLHAWRCGVASSGPCRELLRKALTAAAATVVASRIMIQYGAPDATGLERWQQEVNSSTSYHHGGVAYLRRWGAVVGGTLRNKRPLQVHAIDASFDGALDRVLGPKAHELVQSMQRVSSLQGWVDQVGKLSPELRALRLPGLARSEKGYGVMG